MLANGRQLVHKIYINNDGIHFLYISHIFQEIHAGSREWVLLCGSRAFLVAHISKLHVFSIIIIIILVVNCKYYFYVIMHSFPRNSFQNNRQKSFFGGAFLDLRVFTLHPESNWFYINFQCLKVYVCQLWTLFFFKFIHLKKLLSGILNILDRKFISARSVHQYFCGPRTWFIDVTWLRPCSLSVLAISHIFLRIVMYSFFFP